MPIARYTGVLAAFVGMLALPSCRLGGARIAGVRLASLAPDSGVVVVTPSRVTAILPRESRTGWNLRPDSLTIACRNSRFDYSLAFVARDQLDDRNVSRQYWRLIARSQRDLRPDSIA